MTDVSHQYCVDIIHEDNTGGRYVHYTKDDARATYDRIVEQFKGTTTRVEKAIVTKTDWLKG